MTKRPNILFLMTDEQRNNTFSCINPVVKTPNLDALIKDSVFFSNAYCSNPSCIPSRAAIVTGKYPTACKCPTFITKLPEDEKTFMTLLQESGYFTGVIGKQHFAHSQIYRGYDEELIVDGHFAKEGNDELVHYMKFLKDNGVDITKLENHDYICGGKWLADVKYYIDSYVGDEGKKRLGKHIEETHKEENPKPWFYTISFPGPHQPYDGDGTGFEKLYDLKDMKRNETVLKDLDKKPPHYKKMPPRTYIDQFPEEKFRHTLLSYYANMSLIDNKVADIIKMLKDTGEYDNTMIIYSADHGDFMGDFGMVAKAQYLAEGLMRVPLFVKPPIKDFKGFTVEDRVCNINIASTCLKVANAENKITYTMENNPLSIYWEEKNPKAEDYIYMEAHDLKGTIENGIKVVYYVDRDYGEIYDLNKDPLERINLWDNKDYQTAKTKAMSRIINKLFKLSPKSFMKWNTNAPDI